MDLDGYTIPDLDINDAHQLVMTIHDDLGGAVDSSNEEELAEKHGHSTAESGAFRSKISALKGYGFLEGWGNKELTPLAEQLYRGEARIEDLVEEVDLFEEAYAEFGMEIPTSKDWRNFIDRQDIANAGSKEIEKARNRYSSLVRFCQPSGPGNGGSPFDEERFNKYLDKLEKERTRSYAVEAIEEQARRPLPDIGPFEDILSIIHEKEYPEYEREFHEIVVDMCEQSGEMIREHDHQDSIYELAIDILQAEESEMDREAVQMMDTTFDSDLSQERCEELWQLAQEFLDEGVETESATKQEIAGDIADLLIERWASDEFLVEIEDAIWNDIGEDEKRDTYYESWLQSCRRQIEGA